MKYTPSEFSSLISPLLKVWAKYKAEKNYINKAIKCTPSKFSLISPLLEVGALAHWPHWLLWDLIVGFCLLWRSSTAGAIARSIRKRSDNKNVVVFFFSPYLSVIMVWLLTDLLCPWCINEIYFLVTSN